MDAHLVRALRQAALERDPLPPCPRSPELRWLGRWPTLVWMVTLTRSLRGDRHQAAPGLHREGCRDLHRGGQPHRCCSRSAAASPASPPDLRFSTSAPGCCGVRSTPPSAAGATLKLVGTCEV